MTITFWVSHEGDKQYLDLNKGKTWHLEGWQVHDVELELYPPEKE